MNITGIYTLFCKEVQRFMAVYLQTVMAPVVNAILFLIIFNPFGKSINGFAINNIDYSLFLLPGLIMMSVLQNSFANCSSSIIQAKHYGNILFMLVAPLSALEITVAYVAAAILRSFLVALAVLIAGLFFAEVSIVNPLLMVVYIFLSATIMGCMGLIIGVLAKNYDHLSGFQNFIVLPLIFLSGVFYSTQRLPEFWHQLSLFNPFFYMIDGLRYSMIGHSDIAINTSLMVVSGFTFSMGLLSWYIINRGFGIRN